MKVQAKCWVETSVGQVLLTAQEDGLSGLYFPSHRGGVEEKIVGPDVPDHPIILQAIEALKGYFDLNGTRDLLDSRVPLRLDGTPFQRRVWAQLRLIPPGTTITYAEMARRVDKEGSARAVGQAVASNPVSLFVPCHRVIGSDALLRGYAGGLDRKRWLLQHEQGQMVIGF